MLYNEKINLQTIAENWFKSLGWHPFEFQRQCWDAYWSGESGLLHAPTGSGKTYAIAIGCLLEALSQHNSPKFNALQVIWITPLRALAQDIARAVQRANDALKIGWKIAVRTGDTSSAEKQQQFKQLPHFLVTTPESLHLLLAQSRHEIHLQQLRALVVDEWHELLGTKRGVLIELAIARIKKIAPFVRIWGISATIANLEQAAKVLTQQEKPAIIHADFTKNIQVHTILPISLPKFSYAGQLGIALLPQIMPIIEQSRSTLIFTNTRNQAESWYRAIIEQYPEYIGWVALHHSSLDRQTRDWVENALHEGALKVVICTSTLDIGVDFRPVDTVIQIGSPKGIARFLQRAGRSGHAPGETSRIWLLPSQSLDLLEFAVLKQVARQICLSSSSLIESRVPMTLCFDVLAQYLVTLAVSGGFSARLVFEEVRSTHCFRYMSKADFYSLLNTLTYGGKALSAYEDFCKLQSDDGDFFYVKNKKIATLHRLNIGTIVSEPTVKVQFLSGAYIGTIEESFAARLREGDCFFFGGRSLEFVRLKDLTVQVKLSAQKEGLVPRWQSSRLTLSDEFANLLRKQLCDVYSDAPEMQMLCPLLDLQRSLSAIPKENELLIEYFKDKDGFHLLVYPFAGRAVHEMIATLIAYRISKEEAITFTVAMNDYGFELLSEKAIQLDKYLKEKNIFSAQEVSEDLFHSLNLAEIAKRKFREIAIISGLVVQQYPSRQVSYKNLQVSTQLLFEVYKQYEPENLLYQQSFRESLDSNIIYNKFLQTLKQIQNSLLLIKYPPRTTPFAFPIIVERIRNQISSESVENRILKMQLQLEKIQK
ncbi:MAG: ligase-associated DNA damage response DEXH box helicase [Cytophagales bacterium]|nr:ligase-associated DNA damage response DEXH box helicase [Cytophagales bacterium]MDW8384978.1 ligase-associated DNA damage response DEXH box helicase [Flammeovirgaceae bacterium]